MMILLDTDTVTHLSYGNEKVRRRFGAVARDSIAITVVTRYEVLRGRAENLLKAASEDELRKAVGLFRHAEELLSDLVVVGLDDEAIRHFGRLRKQKNLKKMGRADMLNACIALGNDALLVTRNTKDYKDIAGLRMENWVD